MVVKSVEELAQKKGVSMAQISLAWVMAKDGELTNARYVLNVTRD